MEEKKSVARFMSRLVLMMPLWLFFFTYEALAQNPTNIPRDNRPVQFLESWENIIFYILIPLLIIVLYVVWRRKQNQK